MKEKFWEGWNREDVTPDLLIFVKHPQPSEEELSEVRRGYACNDRFPFYPLIPNGIVFKKTQNPIYAIESFLIAHEAGLFPPMWVLNYMAGIFTDWRKSRGTKSLDKLFKLKPGQGQAPLYKTDAEERRDEWLCQNVFVLNHFFGFTIEEACNMAARRLEEAPQWNKTRLKLKAISEDTIKSRYKRKWCKIFKRLYLGGYLTFPEEAKAEFLKLFPKDSIPLKRRLKKKMVV